MPRAPVRGAGTIGTTSSLPCMLNLHFANRFETLADAARPPPGRAGAGPLGVRGRRGHRAECGHHAPPDHRAGAAPGRLRQRQFPYLARWLWQQTETAGARAAEGSAVRRRRVRLAHPGRVRGCGVGVDAAAAVRLAGPGRRGDAPRAGGRVAGLFDQYLTYRPAWMETWFRDATVALPGADDGAALDQQWQAALWRRLAAETASDGRHPSWRCWKCWTPAASAWPAPAACPPPPTCSACRRCRRCTSSCCSVWANTSTCTCTC